MNEIKREREFKKYWEQWGRRIGISFEGTHREAFNAGWNAHKASDPYEITQTTTSEVIPTVVDGEERKIFAPHG